MTRGELRASIWKHPAGTPVTVRFDDGTIKETRTTSAAEPLGDEAWVWLECGDAYPLRRVSPVGLGGGAR